MDCNYAKEQMHLYFDNELDSQESKQLLAHLEHCNGCKKEFTELQQLLKELQALPTVELPENYHSELMERIKKTNSTPMKGMLSQKKSNFTKQFFWKYSAIVATILFSLLLGNGYTQFLEEKQKQMDFFSTHPLEEEWNEGLIITKEKFIPDLKKETITSPTENKKEEISPSTAIQKKIPPKINQEKQKQEEPTNSSPTGSLNNTSMSPSSQNELTSNPIDDMPTLQSIEAVEGFSNEETIDSETPLATPYSETLTKSTNPTITRSVPQNRKNTEENPKILIQLSIENLNKAWIEIENNVEKSNGMILEQILSSDSNSNSYLKLKMPTENVSSFIEEINSIGEILKKEDTSYILKAEYEETQNRFQNLLMEKENILNSIETNDNEILKEKLVSMENTIKNYEENLSYLKDNLAYTVISISFLETTEQP